MSEERKGTIPMKVQDAIAQIACDTTSVSLLEDLLQDITLEDPAEYGGEEKRARLVGDLADILCTRVHTLNEHITEAVELVGEPVPAQQEETVAAGASLRQTRIRPPA